jgi:hypothetical protein
MMAWLICFARRAAGFPRHRPLIRLDDGAVPRCTNMMRELLHAAGTLIAPSEIRCAPRTGNAVP